MTAQRSGSPSGNWNDQNELLELGTEHEAYVQCLQAERLIRITSRSWPHSASGNVRWKIC